jgi:hypothetical protein
MMLEKMTVPRRRVKKDWYVGLSPDHANHTQNDVHDDSLTSDKIETVQSGTSCDHGCCASMLSLRFLPKMIRSIINSLPKTPEL